MLAAFASLAARSRNQRRLTVLAAFASLAARSRNQRRLTVLAGTLASLASLSC